MSKPIINGVGSTTAGGVGVGGKLQSFEILFDHSDAVYTSGDEITGQIRIGLKEPMKMHMVKLQFVGRTYVGWSEHKISVLSNATKNEKELASTTVVSNGHGVGAVSNGSATQKSKYSNEIVHFDKTIDLLERRPGQEIPDDFVLPAGVNLLPFSFPLPKKSLPTSFESDCGYVRYVCRAVICKPWKHDHVTKRPFTVLSSGWKLATKENYPDLHKPLAQSEVVASKSCCCIKGNVTCEMSVGRQAYNVGETITLGAKLVNNGRRTVNKVVFRLVQVVTCKGQAKDKQGGERTTVVNRIIAEKSFDKPIKRGSTADWNQEKMFKIPPCAPTCVDNATLRVEYQLRADVEVDKRPKEALSVRIPITVLGIPYVTATSRLREDVKDEKPFRFLECHFGQKSVREENDNQFVRGTLEFAPSYPMLVD